MSNQWVKGFFPTEPPSLANQNRVAASSLRSIARDVRSLGNGYRLSPEQAIERREEIETRILLIARQLEAQR